MIDYQRVFHTGVRVVDLDKAMAELGSGLGLAWSAPVEVEQRVWTPDGGATTHPLRFTYSAEGPQHVELLESPPGSPWHAGGHPGVHHVGVWVDDVVAEAERLVDAGWAIVAANLPPEEGLGVFAYVEPPVGAIVELVMDRARPRFEAWWAGGRFG